MKKIVFTVFIVLMFNTAIKAQLISKAKIENIKATMVDDKVEVGFSITHTSKNENVKVELKFKSGDNFIYPKSITGTTNMLAAGNHTIVWDVLKDVEQLAGEIKPIITITETNYKLKAQNAFMPGFNSSNKLLATVSYTFLAAGTIQYFMSKSKYESYKNEMDDSDLRASYLDKAKSAKTQSLILLGTGVGLLATNMILVRVYNKKYNLASLNYNNGAICLSYIHTIHF